jgi:hypothetical protein
MTFIADAFSSKPVKSEPIPTRDTAADAVNAEDDRRRKIGAGYGFGTQMLSGAGGVSGGELTGTRSANG